MLKLFVVIVFSLSSVDCFYSECYTHQFAQVTWYDVRPNQITPMGIEIDSYVPIDHEFVDTSIRKLELCLGVEIDPCIRIKVVPPVKSKCSKWHFLDVEAPQYLCDKKGIELDPECPCRYRWATQQGYEHCDLITPLGHHGQPYLYDIIRVVTNTEFWENEYVECVKHVEPEGEYDEYF